jgi:hypothetical protein
MSSRAGKARGSSGAACTHVTTPAATSPIPNTVNKGAQRRTTLFYRRLRAPKGFKPRTWSGGQVRGSRGIRAGGAWEADFSAFRAVRRSPHR